MRPQSLVLASRPRTHTARRQARCTSDRPPSPRLAASPLHSALRILKSHDNDLDAATAARGDSYLSMVELRALAESKGVDVRDATKKPQLVAKLKTVLG